MIILIRSYRNKECDDMGLIHLVQETVQRCSFGKVVINIWFYTGQKISRMIKRQTASQELQHGTGKIVFSTLGF